MNVVSLAPLNGIPQPDERAGTDIFQNFIITKEIVEPDRRLADILRYEIMRLVKPSVAKRLL